MTQPYLYIIAGPNGAGKSTAISFFKANGFIGSDVPYLNPDVIAFQLKQQHPSISNFETDQIISERRNELIRKGKSLIIESNLATGASYTLIDGARKNFQNCAFFYLPAGTRVMRLAGTRPGVKRWPSCTGGDYNSPI